MHHRRIVATSLLTVAAVAVLGAAALGAAAPVDYARRGETAWADVKVLADDNMEGRRAGSPGHRRAAEYVAAEFRKAGLAPGGDGGWFQRVPLESRTIDESASSVSLVGADGERELEPGVDVIFSLRGNYAPQVEAPLVFAGYGLSVPQYGYDDLADADLEGKVVVAFMAAPKSVPGAVGAHFGSATERWKAYRARGAVGMMLVPNPFSSDIHWERIAPTRFDPFMVLGPPEEDLFAGQKLWLSYNPAKLPQLFAGSPQGADAVLAKLKDGAALPHFDLAFRVRAATAAKTTQVTSENVIGILRGSDPKLRAEYVVLSAHIDHLGIASEAPAGATDKLYNGAMDNASGVAVLLDVARDLRRTKARPKRSIVFAAVTAEESGLLGSRAFVSRAQRTKMRIVADVNTDMFLPLYPLEHLVVFGLEESDLAADARAAAGTLGVAVMSDPQPARNRFIRSDQYSFVRAGIPALALKIGFAADSPQAEIEKKWIAERYHAPGDDLAQPVDFGAMGKFSVLVQRLALRIADRSTVPEWNATSAFAAKPAAP